MTFEDAIRAHGLLPRKAVVPDGRIYRCSTDSHPKKRNGAYLYALDGRFGWFRDWARDDEPVIWRAGKEVDSSLPAPIDFEAQRKRQEEEAHRRQRAISEARRFYNRCTALRGGHPYLEAHGLDMTGCAGLRVDREGWLVVPMMRDGRLVSVQRIAPPGTVPAGEPSKRFHPGAPTRATSYTVDRPDAKYTVLCEGLATGLAIYACSDLVRVVVAFSSHNLTKVAERWVYRGFVTVAADDDWETAAKIGRNPGISAAEDAARILGCGVMVPEGIEGTDWCDLRQERIALGMAAKTERTTEAMITKAVHAGIFREVQKHAVFHLPAQKVG